MASKAGDRTNKVTLEGTAPSFLDNSSKEEKYKFPFKDVKEIFDHEFTFISFPLHLIIFFES